VEIPSEADGATPISSARLKSRAIGGFFLLAWATAVGGNRAKGAPAHELENRVESEIVFDDSHHVGVILADCNRFTIPRVITNR
jgi:hypothetical protein